VAIYVHIVVVTITILDSTEFANLCTARIHSAVLGKRTDKKTEAPWPLPA